MKIIHVDMDCFYAAVEMRENPRLANRPLAVGGDADRRGVIATCNYEARRYGVRSAMATAKALRLCPQLKVVRGNMPLYKEVSRQIQSVFRRYTDLIEPLSLDEAYLDVTDSEHCQGSATLIAQQIRKDILQLTGLTASAGVAPNKFLAKVASDINKPDGLFVIPPEKVDEFVTTLPLNKIPGVGKASMERLTALGLQTAGDVRGYNKETLVRHFGKMGSVLAERCEGIDERQVVTKRIRKSVGVERTLADDLQSEMQCWNTLETLYPELCRRITKADCQQRIARVGVKLKFSDFRQTTVEHSGFGFDLSRFRPLLQQAYARSSGKSVRLVGLHVGLRSQQSGQLSLPF